MIESNQGGTGEKSGVSIEVISEMCWSQIRIQYLTSGGGQYVMLSGVAPRGGATALRARAASSGGGEGVDQRDSSFECKVKCLMNWV